MRRPPIGPMRFRRASVSCARLATEASEVASASALCSRPSGRRGPMKSRLSARFTATAPKLARTAAEALPSA